MGASANGSPSRKARRADQELAGATAVAVGTALFVDPSCLTDIREGINDYLDRRGHASVTEIIGALQA